MARPASSLSPQPPAARCGDLGAGLRAGWRAPPPVSTERMAPASLTKHRRSLLIPAGGPEEGVRAEPPHTVFRGPGVKRLIGRAFANVLGREASSASPESPRVHRRQGAGPAARRAKLTSPSCCPARSQGPGSPQARPAPGSPGPHPSHVSSRLSARQRCQPEPQCGHREPSQPLVSS